nr:HipA N-terminal domain-containing protein [Arenimonas sp.]
MAELAGVRHALVSTPQANSGMLASEDGRYLFTYSPDAPPAADISLLMPHRADQYASPTLHPIFQMNLPEGYVLEQLRNRLAKATPLDPMLLLALTGREAAIGRVRIEAPALEASLGESRHTDKGESLKSILAWDGAENLFDALAQRYLFRTGVSGVQPKLLVPELPESAIAGKTSIATSDLIVKSGGADFPGLAVNEYVCMLAVKEAGLPVPEFHLSDNHQLFVMRRFDRLP